MHGLTDLTWFPKRNGAGDIDGAGSRRLLGQPELDLCNLLVRETAQNSWDARIEGTVPEFQIRCRSLAPQHVDVLTHNVFRGTAPESRLGYLLSRAALTTALEISDRGTKGLGGGLRNDVVQDPPHDWVDFVLAVGSPPDNNRGGGTYGFGKTASYVASECATILIWSATQHEGAVQHRFIASAMDLGFAMEGQRFTGRQWWCRVVIEDGVASRVEPVVGDAARQLGEALFERHFLDGETGTSILILQPWAPNAEDDLTWAETLPRAIVENLWPKLLPGQPDEHRMDIRAFDHRKELDIVPGDSRTFDALGRTLMAVRDGDAAPDDMFRQTFQVHVGRPRAHTGNLVLTGFLPKSDDPYKSLANRVALMRTPELVIRSQDYPLLQDSAHSAWVGVFKPFDEHDRTFAQAEPPAHDAWIPNNMSDRTAKTLVNVSLREITNHVRQYLTPAAPDDAPTKSAPTAAVSESLAGLAGATRGSRPSPAASRRGTTSPSGKSRGKKSGRASISKITPLPSAPDLVAKGIEQSRVHFDVELGNGPGLVALSRLAISIDGSSLKAETEVGIEKWSTAEHGSKMSVTESGEYWVDVFYPSGVAIDVDVKMEDPA